MKEEMGGLFFCESLEGFHFGVFEVGNLLLIRVVLHGDSDNVPQVKQTKKKIEIN